jgi:hypothetical protein
MKTLLLIGPVKSLTQTERATLWGDEFKGYFTDEDLDARIPAHLSVRKDTTGDVIPYIHFPSNFDAQRFFRAVGDKKIYKAFTTLPFSDLVAFDKKVFEFIDGQFTFTITASVNRTDGFGSYSNRLLTFTRTSVQPGIYNLGTKIEISHLAEKAASDQLFPLFFDPVEIDLDRNKLNLLYRAFYKVKGRDTDFPLVLPPIYDQEGDDSYFNDQNHLVRAEIDVALIDIFPEVASTLGFKLWRSLENPVLRDFLKEGSFFELKSKPAIDSSDLFPFFEDGEPVLQLVYPLKKDNTDFIYNWRHDLFFSSDKNEHPVAASINKNNTTNINLSGILAAIKSDIKEAVAGLELNIVCSTFNYIDSEYWSTIKLSPFKAGTPFYYKMIENFSAKLNIQVQGLIQKRVLEFAVDGSAFDLKRPLEAFCGYYWKYPFERNTDNVSGWTRFLVQLIHQEGKTIADYGLNDDLIVNADGEYTYGKAYAPEEILTIRLLLPARAYLRSRYNNILDHSNAKLDHHFILD